jgi:fumarylacetoacetate (FAA) hydrolase
MKLATLKTTNRDGQLIVVSKDLKTAVKVMDIAPTLQDALDNWSDCEKALQAKYEALNQGKASSTFAFDVNAVCSPLPRAYQWADASAYVNHVELVRKSRGVECPKNFGPIP